MAYNKLLLQDLLPNPGLPNDPSYSGKEEDSFPPGPRSLIKTMVQVNASTKGEFRKKTDDLTFIIPYATADDDRKFGLLCTIAWIMSTTTAKIIVCSSENEETFGRFFKNPDNFQKHVPVTFDEYSDESFSLARKQEYALTEVYYEICKRFYAAYALKVNFGLDIQGDPNLSKSFLDRVSFVFAPRKKDEPFHRTKYLNMMLDKVKTKFVCNHDADTLLSSAGISNSMAFLRTGTASVVYPFERSIKAQKRVHFKNGAPPGPLNSFILSGDMSLILHDDYGILEWSASYGQSIFFSTQSYKDAGGENEEFVSWGAEDLERYNRFLKLGLSVARVDAPIVHIEHPRGLDSSSAHKDYSSNESLASRLTGMSSDEIKDYYKNVSYKKKYGW